MLHLVAKIEDLLQRRTDLSTFLVHLTRSDAQSAAFDNLKSIISSSTIKAVSPFGPAATYEAALAEAGSTQKAVCLTETPLEHVWMMLEEIDGRSVQFESFGLAITKTTGRKAGFNPVWYSDISRWGYDWPITSVNKMISDAVSRATDPEGHLNTDRLRSESVFKVTPFFEQMGPTTVARKEFWWEREWRKIDYYHISFPNHVVALLAPAELHVELERFLVELDEKQNTKWIKRPILDPRWGLERMIACLAKTPDEHLGPFPEAGY